MKYLLLILIVLSFQQAHAESQREDLPLSYLSARNKNNSHEIEGLVAAGLILTNKEKKMGWEYVALGAGTVMISLGLISALKR